MCAAESEISTATTTTAAARDKSTRGFSSGLNDLFERRPVPNHQR